MQEFSVIVQKFTGDLFNGRGYINAELPSDDAIPMGCELIKVTESTQDFEILYSLFIHDENRVATEYTHPTEGGCKYDYVAKKFILTKIDLSIDADEVRQMRNKLLSDSDMYMLLPDLPESLMVELQAYRQQLRDITDKIGSEWQTKFDVEYPNLPEAFLMI